MDVIFLLCEARDTFLKKNPFPKKVEDLFFNLYSIDFKINLKMLLLLLRKKIK